MELVLTLAAFAGGALLITKAVTGAKWRQVLGGQAEAVYRASHPSSGSSAAAPASTGAPVTSGGVAPEGVKFSTMDTFGNHLPSTPLTGITSNSVGQVTRAMLQPLARARGWTRSQVSDWLAVIDRESGGQQNPTEPAGSTAYGVGQFINGPEQYTQYGGNPNTLQGQLEGMANYIAGRYGTPSRALASENERGWY